MVTEPTHIHGGVLTDIPNVVGVWVGSPVGISDHSAIFIDVVLEQPIPIPLLMCRHDVYLKNSMRCEKSQLE